MKTCLMGTVQGWQSVPVFQAAEEDRYGLSCKKK